MGGRGGGGSNDLIDPLDGGVAIVDRDGAAEGHRGRVNPGQGGAAVAYDERLPIGANPPPVLQRRAVPRGLRSPRDTAQLTVPPPHQTQHGLAELTPPPPPSPRSPSEGGTALTGVQKFIIATARAEFLLLKC